MLLRYNVTTHIWVSSFWVSSFFRCQAFHPSHGMLRFSWWKPIEVSVENHTKTQKHKTQYRCPAVFEPRKKSELNLDVDLGFSVKVCIAHAMLQLYCSAPASECPHSFNVLSQIQIQSHKQRTTKTDIA